MSIILEHRIDPKTDKYVKGYFLTIEQLCKLVRDFQVDNHDGFVSNDKTYIEYYLTHKKL